MPPPIEITNTHGQPLRAGKRWQMRRLVIDTLQRPGNITADSPANYALAYCVVGDVMVAVTRDGTKRQGARGVKVTVKLADGDEIVKEFHGADPTIAAADYFMTTIARLRSTLHAVKRVKSKAGPTGFWRQKFPGETTGDACTT